MPRDHVKAAEPSTTTSTVSASKRRRVSREPLTAHDVAPGVERDSRKPSSEHLEKQPARARRAAKPSAMPCKTTTVITPEDAVPPSVLPLSPTARRACQGLLDFFRDSGVNVDWSSVHMDPDEASGGWRIIAARELPRGVVLGTVPKSACLSIRTTTIAKDLELEGLSGGLGLTTAVMMERALGGASQWSGYFDSLPASAPLPVFWPDVDVAALSGTELDGAPAGELDALADDYRMHVAPFLRQRFIATGAPSLHVRGGTVSSCQLAKAARLCDFAAFARAASLVSSRAFHVDEWHGDAMVPFADVFNHRSAVIVLGNAGLKIEGHGDDEDTDGEEDNEGEAQEESGDEDQNDAHDDTNGAADGVAHSAHATPLTGMPIVSSTVRDELGRVPEHPEHPLNIAICNIDGDDAANVAPALEIVLMHAVAKGVEVWNTYGELSSGALLMKYGFAPPFGNPHAIVNIDAGLALHAAEVCCGPQARELGERLLSTPMLFDDDGLFEIGVADHTPPPSLVFFAHCIAGGANKTFSKALAKDAVALARSTDAERMLECAETRQCLAAILLARLGQYASGHGAGGKTPFDETAAAAQLALDERSLERAESKGRNPRRVSALRLRVEEQRIALAVLSSLLKK